MKKQFTPLTVVLLFVTVILLYSNWKTAQQVGSSRDMRQQIERLEFEKRDTLKAWRGQAETVQILRKALTDWQTAKERGSMPIPTCEAIRISVDKVHELRPWGNGVEVDLPDKAELVHCDTLQSASPK